MGKLRTFLKLTKSLFIYLVLFSNLAPAIVTTELPNNNRSNNNLTRNQNLIPIQYEIGIGPFQNSSDVVRVSCWVKITAEIEKNACTSVNNNNSGTLISLNSRNSTLDLESLTVSKSTNGEQMQLLRIKNVSVENPLTEKEFSGVPKNMI